MTRLFLLLLWMAASAAAAQTAVPQAATLLRDEVARSEPFIDAAPAGSLKAGARVGVLERRGTWVRIERPAGWLRGAVLRAEGGQGVSPAATVAALPSGREGSGTAVTLAIRGRPPGTPAGALADAVFAARDTVRRVNLARSGAELTLDSSHAGVAYVIALDGPRLIWLYPRVDEVSGAGSVLPGQSLRIAAPAAALPLLAIVADSAIDEMLPDKRLENGRVVIEPSEAALPELARALTLGRFGCEGAACPLARYGAARLP